MFSVARTHKSFIYLKIAVVLQLWAFCLTEAHLLHTNFQRNVVGLEGGQAEQGSQENLRHYALDPKSATKFALAEQKIYTTLLVISLFKTGYEIELPEQDLCNQSLKKYLKDYEHDNSPLGGATGFLRAKMISENPLLLFRMIRRTVSILKVEILEVCRDVEGNQEIIDAIQNTLKAKELALPTDKDMNDALIGLLRVQYVYGLNATSELRLGVLQGMPTNVTLTVDDCIMLGLKALEHSATVMAYQWFTAGNLTFSEKLSEENRTDAKMKLDLCWANFLKVVDLPTADEAHKKFRDLRQNTATRFRWYPYKHYETCRGESTLPEDIKGELKCYSLGVAIHEYFIFQQLKMEQLHIDPPLWLFHNFLENGIIEYIKKNANKPVRSGVVENSEDLGSISEYRTSTQSWIYDDDLSYPGPEMTALNKRLGLLLNMEVFKRGSSQALQIVQYSPLGGHYDFHSDSLQDSIHVQNFGDRIATFLMFLTDVELGGYTGFPEMRTFVKPHRGDAILWRNLFLNGNEDLRTTHGGCPVIKGIKLAANKWIMQFNNIFRFKCSLNLDD